MYFTNDLNCLVFSLFCRPCEYITNFLIMLSFPFLVLVHRKTDQFGLRLFIVHINLFVSATFQSLHILEEIVRLFARAFCNIQFQGFRPILTYQCFGSWIVDFEQISSLHNMLSYRFQRLFLLDDLSKEQNLVPFGNLGIFAPFFSFKNRHFRFFNQTQVVKYLYRKLVW